MPITVTMPRLSDTMEQGTVVKWHVAEGDAVSMGDVLADIETDKATMEMQVYDDGVIASIFSKLKEISIRKAWVILILTEVDSSEV